MINRTAINAVAINATVAAVMAVGHGGVISGGGSHTASGINPGRAAAVAGGGRHVASGFKSSGGTARIAGAGNHAGSGQKHSTNLIVVTLSARAGGINSFALNSFPINGSGGAGGSATIPVSAARISGGGNQIASGQKPAGTFGRISDSGYLLGAGQKNAFGAGRITGSGQHVAVGKQRGNGGLISGGGSHRALGKRDLEFALISGGGAHRSSGVKQVAGYASISGSGRLIALGHKGETSSLSCRVHIGPLLTCCIHISPVGLDHMRQIVPIGATGVVRVTQLENTETSERPTDATALCTVLDAAGVPVIDAIALALHYTPASTGHAARYFVVLPSTLPLVAGDITVRLIITTIDSNVLRVDVPCTAKVLTGSESAGVALI